MRVPWLCGSLGGGGLDDLEAPDLGRGGGRPALAMPVSVPMAVPVSGTLGPALRRRVLGRLGMALPEGLALGPALEVLLAAPLGDDEIPIDALDRAQQVEALEALGRLDQSGAAAEAPLELVPHLGLDGQHVGLHDRHASTIRDHP